MMSESEGNVAARKDVFHHPWVCRRGRPGVADRMNQRHTIVVEQLRDFSEKYVVITKPDMFEHADRDDPVEALVDMAIVLQLKLSASRLPGILEPLFCDGELLLRQGYAGDVGAADLREIERHAAPAAADVEDTVPRFDEELRRDVAFLRQLRFVKRRPVAFEIGTGILPVLIQKEAIKTAIEIVMMGDVASRPLDTIALHAPQRTPQSFDRPQPKEIVEASHI